MGLIAGTAVSVSIIDAHAETLGTLGATGVSVKWRILTAALR